MQLYFSAWDGRPDKGGDAGLSFHQPYSLKAKGLRSGYKQLKFGTHSSVVFRFGSVGNSFFQGETPLGPQLDSCDGMFKGSQAFNANAAPDS